MKCEHDGGNCWASVCGVGSCEMLQLIQEALRAVKPVIRAETQGKPVVPDVLLFKVGK